MGYLREVFLVTPLPQNPRLFLLTPASPPYNPINSLKYSFGDMVSTRPPPLLLYGLLPPLLYGLLPLLLYAPSWHSCSTPPPRTIRTFRVMGVWWLLAVLALVLRLLPLHFSLSPLLPLSRYCSECGVAGVGRAPLIRVSSAPLIHHLLL